MELAEPVPDEAPRHGHRIREPHALRIVRAADELDAGAFAQVDRGNHQHGIAPGSSRAAARDTACEGAAGSGSRQPSGMVAERGGAGRTWSRNAPSSRTPARELFSGWNCSPSTLRRRIAAANR